MVLHIQMGTNNPPDFLQSTHQEYRVIMTAAVISMVCLPMLIIKYSTMAVKLFSHILYMFKYFVKFS